MDTSRTLAYLNLWEEVGVIAHFAQMHHCVVDALGLVGDGKGGFVLDPHV